MAGYSTGEALLLAALRLHANYDTGNSSRGNFRILDKGESSTGYALIFMGRFDDDVASLGGIGSTATATNIITWRSDIWLLRRYKDSSTTTTLQNDVETVRAHLVKYRYLATTNNEIIDFTVTGGGPMEGLTYGGIEYIMVILNVEWQEQQTVTFAE